MKKKFIYYILFVVYVICFDFKTYAFVPTTDIEGAYAYCSTGYFRYNKDSDGVYICLYKESENGNYLTLIYSLNNSSYMRSDNNGTYRRRYVDTFSEFNEGVIWYASNSGVGYLTGDTNIVKIDNVFGLTNVLEYLLGEPINGDDLGYLTDVKYFVDSAAYQYDPSDTPEWIQWGQYSTTGIDLFDIRYQVEFALEDQSSYYMNRNSDYVSQYGWSPLGSVGQWALEARDYVKGLIAPTGSNFRAVLQGKSVNTSFYGKFLSAGTVQASLKQYKISAVSSYLNGLDNTISASGLLEGSDEWSFRNFLQGYSDNPSNGYIGHMAQNISQLGKLYSMSYNIMARIVDTNSGVTGDWLKIDRHNTPYWDGHEEDFLNGRVTATVGNKYTVNNFGDTFTSPGEKVESDKTKPIYLPVGYRDPVTGNGNTIYNNYTYNNNYFNYGGDINNFTYRNYDGDEISGSSDALDLLGILGVFGLFFTWYSVLFGDFLPVWAIVCIPVFGLIFVAVTTYKFGKSLL